MNDGQLFDADEGVDWKARYDELVALVRESRPRACGRHGPTGFGLDWAPCEKCASCRLRQLVSDGSEAAVEQAAE